jgi:Trypsin
VINTVRHPDHDSETKVNDIALSFLDVPVPAITNIAYNDDPSIPTDYEMLTAIGAGRTTFEGLLPHELMELDLLKVNDDNCSSAFPS